MHVFVTGAASGFGRALVRRLHGLGHRVTATDRHGDALRAAHADLIGDRCVVATMDVTDAAQVASVTGAVDDVDVLVNDAGYAVFTTQAEADLAGIERMFATNVLGVARVTQALLPQLRARAGTVVQLSSVAGRMVFPESGFYAGSKYAVEAMSEALYLENGPFGLRVIVVEPGSFATGFQARAQAESPPRRPDSVYAGAHPTWDLRRAQVLEAGQPPEQVADAIIAALADPRPFRRVRVGPDAERLLGLRDAASADGWVHLMANRYGGYAGGRDTHDPLGDPAEVLARVQAGEPVPALVRAALACGHLDHWEERVPGILEVLRRA